MKASIYYNGSYDENNTKHQLYLRVRIDGKYLKLPLNIYVTSKEYSKDKQKVTKGSRKNIYNKIIDDAIGSAARIFLKYEVNEKALTRELFEKEFRKPEILTDFYAFMDHEINIRDGEITKTSIKQHKTILNKMKAYRPSLMLSEIDENFIREFKRYLQVTLKNKNNTVNNALKIVKVYVNKAIQKELISRNPFRYIKFKKEQTYPEFLSEDEMVKLISLYERNELPDNLQNVLRWFLFGSQTGLRIGDLRNARHEDIRNNILSVHPIKTQNVNNRRVDIPLTKLAKQLIKEENPFKLKGLLFDCMSEQRMNKNIKKIMRYEGIEIDKDISFHNARHTFATLFLKKSRQANGIIMLQRMLGHSSIETTMVYAHILNDDLMEAMSEFNF